MNVSDTLETLLSSTFRRVYRRGDRLMVKFIGFHVLLTLCLAPVYHTWMISLPIAAIGFSMFVVSRYVLPETRFTRCLAGVSLQIFVALHIYQLHGLPEMHFFFFPAFTMMIVYQDWFSLWPGTILIIGQHTLFALLHNTGENVYFFTESYVSFMKLFFHFSIVLAHVMVCSYWSYLLRQQTINQVRRNMRLRSLLQQSRLQEEELRRATLAAEAASRAKSNFLANMSHEIRTPLNGILGIAEIITMESHEDGTQQYASLIKESGDRLLRTINAVLDLAKIEAQKVEAHLTVCDVRQSVEQVVRLMRVLAQQKDLTIAVMPTPEPVYAELDENLFGQIMNNLIGNAIKFTDTGGIRISIEKISNSAGECEVRIRVIDTGVGIPAQYITELFQPFTQASSGLGRRYQGTGLGLAISKNFVELMNGKITVQSEPYGGSMFEVRFPCCN